MPVPTETKTFNGPRGIADVRVYKDYVSIAFEDEDLGTYKIPKGSGVPDTLNQGGKFNVSLNKDSDAIWSIFPAEGTFEVRFKEFPAGEDKEPTPKQKEGRYKRGKNGKQWYDEAHLQMTFLLEITTGKYEGMVIPYFVRYLFAQYENTGMAKLYGTAGNKARLIEVMEFCGLDMMEDNIPFSDNVLPYLQDLFQERDTRFLVRVQNGWANQLSPPIE